MEHLEKINIIKNHINNGKTLKEISEILNIKYKTLLYFTNKNNIKSNTGSQGARKYKFNENFFDCIDTEDKAYWLGFIAADGCIFKDSGSLRLQINLKGDDIDHLNKFQNSINSTYKISEKMIKDSRVCQLKVNSKLMCEALISQGIIERKSLVVKMPELKDDLVRHFIRGYFDGDGCIYFNETSRVRVCFSIVGGFDMLDSIIKSLPVDSSIRNVRNEIYEINVSKMSSIISLYDYLYKDSNVYLDRKKEKFFNTMSRLVEIQGQ